MIVTNARVLTFDRANRVLSNASVDIRADGTIGAITPDAPPTAAETVDAAGRLLMPALINCHTHLYSTLARGLALPGPPPKNFPQILRKLWWRIDCALNEEDVYYSALIGLIDSAKSGVSTVLDHHSSPNACPGILDCIEQAFRAVGLRGALCYETTGRNGARKAMDGIRENVRFIEQCRRRGDGMVGATFGLHAAFTLNDSILRHAAEANQSLKTGFHVHVAEDACDRGAVSRLAAAGALDERTLAAHCLHLGKRDIACLARHGVNAIHNPQSNCNNAAGTADLPALMHAGITVGLGSDGYSPRMWDEFKTAAQLQKLRARDPRPGLAEAYAAAFLNNRAIVEKIRGVRIGRIETGAPADLILVDYFPPTPLSPENLAGHLLFGISNAPVDSLMVNGRFVVRNRRCVTVDERAAAEKAALQTRSLWRRIETS